MTLKEAAAKCGVSHCYVRQLGKNRRTEGVVLFGNTQVIPADTQKPPRKKHKSREPKK